MEFRITVVSGAIPSIPALLTKIEEKFGVMEQLGMSMRTFKCE